MDELIDTTFKFDFDIADMFGTNAIKDTYNRAFNEWKDDYKYLTALVLVLNHKIWEHYEKHNDSFAQLYDKLWRETDDYALDNLKDRELEYYLNILD